MVKAKKLVNQKTKVLDDVAARSKRVDDLDAELGEEREALYDLVLDAFDSEVAGATELANAAGWVRQRIYQLQTERREAATA